MNAVVATGQLAELLDPARALRLFRRAGLAADDVRITYSRLKRGESALVGYAFRGRDARGRPLELPGYARTFADGRAGAVAAKWSRKRVRATPLGNGVRRLPGGRSLLCLFPNDAELAGLARAASGSKLRYVLADLLRAQRFAVRTVRYKPERRWVGRADDGDHALFLRLFAAPKADVLARTIERFRAAGVAVPRPLGTALHGRLYVEEDVCGEPLLASILRGAASEAAVADTLRRLHAVPAVGEAPALAEVFEGACRTAALLAQAHESLRDPAQAVLAVLERHRPEEALLATLHGDLHAGQLVVAARGPVLVDLERTAAGDPLADIGSFVASTLATALQRPAARAQLHGFLAAFLRAYAPDRRAEDLDFHVARGLLGAALEAWRAQEPEWERRAAAILALAGEPLDLRTGPPVWSRLYPRRAGVWPGWSGDGRPGLFHPESGGFRAVDPGADEHLPLLARWIERGELVAYRAGKRAVVRLEGEEGAVFAKVCREPERLFERHCRLAEALEGSGRDAPALPRQLGAGAGAVLLAEAPGRSLHDYLRTGDAVRELAVAARGIARLHAVPPDALGLDARARAGTRAWLETVARAEPRAALRYRCLADALERAPVAQTPHTLHGDLHDKNLLVEDRRLWLLDLDGARAGDPAEDVGNLCGHLVLRALQRDEAPSAAYGSIARFLEAYGPVDAEAVRYWIARTLFRLACIYRFRRPWRHLVDDLLAEAARWPV